MNHMRDCPPNVRGQLQAYYNQRGEAASLPCLSACSAVFCRAPGRPSTREEHGASLAHAVEFHALGGLLRADAARRDVGDGIVLAAHGIVGHAAQHRHLAICVNASAIGPRRRCSQGRASAAWDASNASRA